MKYLAKYMFGSGCSMYFVNANFCMIRTCYNYNFPGMFYGPSIQSPASQHKGLGSIHVGFVVNTVSDIFFIQENACNDVMLDNQMYVDTFCSRIPYIHMSNNSIKLGLC
jgi:hypothetical protein